MLLLLQIKKEHPEINSYYIIKKGVKDFKRKNYKKDYTKKEDDSKNTVKASSVASKSTRNTDFERNTNKKYKPGSIASYANMLSRDESKK